MKKIASLFLLLFASNLFAQQTRVPVIADTNGFLITVTNLFDENSNALNRAVGNVQTNRDYFWRTNISASGGFSNFWSPITVLGPETNIGHLAVTGHVQVAGTVTATNISGQFGVVSNGAWTSAKTTNLVNYGNAISSPNTAFLLAEQIGSGAQANSLGALAVGGSSTASGFTSAAIGNGSTASGSASTAVGVAALATAANTTAVGNSSTASNANSSAWGYLAATTLQNQNRIGSASQYLSVPGGSQVEGYTTNLHAWGTNTFDAGADISFGRYAITTIANGNNAGVILGTNVFVEISGASAAFTNNGFAGGRDGKLAIIVYQGGQSWTVANESGVDPVAANRIRTGTGADLVIPGNPGMLILIYSGAASRWLLYTPAQVSVASAGSFITAGIGTLTLTNQLPATNVAFTVVQTNFVSGLIYTNFYGVPIEVSATAVLTEAAVAGTSTMEARAIGTRTNFFSLPTAIGAVTGSSQGYLSVIVPINGTYTFTNTSTGAGNTSAPLGGQILIY